MKSTEEIMALFAMTPYFIKQAGLPQAHRAHRQP